MRRDYDRSPGQTMLIRVQPIDKGGAITYVIERIIGLSGVGLNIRCLTNGDIYASIEGSSQRSQWRAD